MSFIEMEVDAEAGVDKSKAQAAKALVIARVAAAKAKALVASTKLAYNAQKRKTAAALSEYELALAADKRQSQNIYENGWNQFLSKIESDVGKLDRALFGKAKKHKKAKRKPKHKPAPLPIPTRTGRKKWPVVYEGVDNSLAAQQSRKNALKAVAEDIEDNAKFGSIAERHLREGHKQHKFVDATRENFWEHQDSLATVPLIRMKDRIDE